MLGHELVGRAPLLQASSKFQQRIKVLVDAQEARNVEQVIVRIINAGEGEIKEVDFARPISLDFGADASVVGLSWELQPEDLNPTFTARLGGLDLSPILLNPTDSITIYALVSGCQKVEVNARFVGVFRVVDSIIEQSREAIRKQYITTLRLYSVILPFLGILTTSLAVISSPWDMLDVFFMVVLSLLLTYLAWDTVGASLYKLYKNRRILDR